MTLVIKDIMNKRYCLTYEYPGVCWTYESDNPQLFFECDEHYNMLPKLIQGVIKLNFKKYIDKEDIPWIY